MKSAMVEAGRKAGKKRYDEVKKMEKGCRRAIHDDITVVVVFIDQQKMNMGIDELSMRGFNDSTSPSGFRALG